MADRRTSTGGRRAAAAVAAAFLLCGGCVNAVVRAQGREEFGGRLRGAPVLCAPRPYVCTAEAFAGWFCAPARAFGWLGGGADARIAAVYLLPVWPLSLADLPCEAALDTAFLPADLAWRLSTKEKEK